MSTPEAYRHVLILMVAPHLLSPSAVGYWTTSVKGGLSGNRMSGTTNRWGLSPPIFQFIRLKTKQKKTVLVLSLFHYGIYIYICI